MTAPPQIPIDFTASAQVPVHDALKPFHPVVRAWFQQTLGEPPEPQIRGWPLIRARKDVLIAAPTGSGKTLTAFLACLDEAGILAANARDMASGEANGLTPALLDRLREVAAGADAPTLVVGYPGLAHRPDEPPVEHATVDPESDPQEAAIVDARRRIFDWFDAHLR